MPDEPADVVVVGAGIAGLAAAHSLRERGRRVLVLEADDRPGGRTRTETWAGCQIELGAVYLTPDYSRVMRLVEAVSLRSEIVPLPNAIRAAIRRDGQWHHFDFARTLNLPGRALDLARFSALRWRDRASLAKLLPQLIRAAPRMRFFDMASAAAADTAPVDEVVTPDAARYFLSPVTELFCGYRPEDFGLALVAMGARFPSRPLTLRSGIGGLSAALAADLDVRCGTRVTRVEPDGRTGQVSVAAREADARDVTYQAGAVVIAAPADAALEVWPGAPEHVRSFLGSAGYSDGYVLWLRTTRRFQPLDRKGRALYMELLPAEGGRALHALGFLNHAAPDGGLLLAAATASARASLDDEALATALQQEVEELHPELSGQVVDRRSLRHPKMVPCFPVGRSRELRDFRAGLTSGPIQLAGDYLFGPCMESAAQSGAAAAERADAHLAP